MRRSFAVSLALLSLGSIASLAAPGCNNEAFDVQDLCGWIADECNCYRRFAAGVAPGSAGVASAPKCGIALDANNNPVDGVDDASKQTFGAFSARDKLDVCLLLRPEGGQIVFDPPLDVAAFPNPAFAFKIVDGSGDVCATGSYASITNFSIGFPAPATASGTGGTGGAGTGGTGGTGGNTPEDICREAHDPAAAPIASGTFEMKPGDASQIVETVCADGEVHRFNLYQLNKCDGNELNEKNFKALLPTAEIEADPGAANVDGFIQFRVFWPPTDKSTTGDPTDLSGQKPHAVEYFHCLIPGASAPCFDDALSDGETDVDCGGLCPQDCDDGKDCLVGADCKSKVCEKDAMGFLKCVSPPCGDLDVTGNETCDDGNVMPGDGCSDTCQEEPGYTCAGPGPCVDIDECATGTDNCPTGTDCVNTPGSFTCECDPGFAWDGMKCVGNCGDGDLKPPEGCDDGNIAGGDGCTPNCTKEPGYFCMGEGPGSCVDINECAGMGACLPTETCMNEIGSFTCTCNLAIAAVCGDPPVCIDTQSDVFNCGGCDSVCLPNQGCFKGNCCQAPANAFCGACTDTMTDEANCGMCGTTCAVGGTCLMGMCCNPPNTACGAACVNTQTDANNCGTCGNVCPMATPMCIGGMCM
ncbi:MAG: hypothetical protein IPK82_11755 [Polyangiaceae bacterium]|nr:hypothetical protein [Polyangiaceae bacterium]